MIINPSDKYIDHIILLTNMDEDSKNRLREDAERVYGSPWGLALKDFFALSEGDLTYIGLERGRQLTASIRQFVWMHEFSEVVEQVIGILQKLQIPQSDDAKRASEYCLKSTSKESVYLFTRRYFGLRNFNEAAEIPLSDFILAKKDDYNSAIYQHAMNGIMRNKFKKK